MSLYDFRQTTRKIQNALSGYSNLENLIRESTNTDAWGPTTLQKKQLLSWILTYTGPSGSTDYYDTQEAYRSNDNDIHVNQSSYDSEVGTFTIDFIFERLDEYSSRRPKSLYDSLKKSLVTKGYEFVIITKCLNLLDFLLLNCFTEKGGILEYDVVDDIKRHKQSLNRLRNYKVTLSYDNLNLNHEKQINLISGKLIDLIENSNLLRNERSKFHPSLARDKFKSATAGRRPSNLFYEQSTLGTFNAETFRKEKDPFARSSVSSISKQIGTLVVSPSKPRKKTNSISLGDDDDNNFINQTKADRDIHYNFNRVKYKHENDVKRSEFMDIVDDYEDKAKPDVNKYKIASDTNGESGDSDEDDEFGGFQSSSSIPESHTNTSSGLNTKNSIDTNKDILDLFSTASTTTPVSPILPKSSVTQHKNYLFDSSLQPISDNSLSRQNISRVGTSKDAHKMNENEDFFNNLLLDFKTSKPK